MKPIEEIVSELRPEQQQEVTDFALFLLEKSKATAPGRRLKLTWAGGLREFRDQYTSLELQKKALEWRDGGGL